MKGRGPTCDSPAVAPVLACDSWLPLSAPALSSSRVSPWVSRVSAYLGLLFSSLILLLAHCPLQVEPPPPPPPSPLLFKSLLGIPFLFWGTSQNWELVLFFL